MARRRNYVRSAVSAVNAKLSIKAASLVLASSTSVSALLGIFRDRWLNSMYYDTYPAGIDAYTAAFLVPDFLYMIITSGALSVTFIPILNERLMNKDKKEAWVSNNETDDYRYEGEITIPEQITYKGKIYPVVAIRWEAFAFSDKLTIVYLPNTIKRIMNSAFNRCSALKAINIPESVEEIEGFAFLWCTGLTSIKIPTSVTKMSPTAFYCCKGFPMENGLRYADRFLIETDKQQQHYTLKEDTRWIGVNAFSDNPNLASIDLPQSVEMVGSFAFSQCPSLLFAELHRTSITWIGDGAFSSCTTLDMVTLPKTLKEIPQTMFWHCWNLKEIYCLAPAAPLLVGDSEDNAFRMVDKEKCQIHVPKGSLFDYKEAKGWQDFKLIDDEAIAKGKPAVNTLST